MGTVVLHDEETGGESAGASPRLQLHDLIDTLTDEAIPPVLDVLRRWLEGPCALLPLWGLVFVVGIS